MELPVSKIAQYIIDTGTIMEHFHIRQGMIIKSMSGVCLHSQAGRSGLDVPLLSTPP